MCVKCAGEHKVDVCDNEEIKCANCEEEHKSSSSECRIYQVKLDEKLKVINKSNPKIGASVRQYSQVVDTNRENETLKDTLIASITDSFQTMQMKIDASFSAQTTELKTSIQKVEADVHLYKAKEFYVHCDMFRIMNNNNPLTSEQLRAFHDSFKFHHNFEINMTSAASYNKNGGHKKKNNKEIMYLNE